MGKSRRKFDLEYKRRIIEEYVSGGRSAKEIAEAEGLETGQIYNWKSQLEQRAKRERIEDIQSKQGISPEEARRIQELEEGLAAAKEKIADQALAIDLLKKFIRIQHPRKGRVGTSKPREAWLEEEGGPNDCSRPHRITTSPRSLGRKRKGGVLSFVMRSRECAEHPRSGYRTLQRYLRRQGYRVGETHLRRVMRENSLQLSSPRLCPNDGLGARYPGHRAGF